MAMTKAMRLNKTSIVIGHLIELQRHIATKRTTDSLTIKSVIDESF
jgi:hypothetical protein